jgi:glycosyltransferase involved in cell wall biosynthesis/GT2 family glycosyltransferase
VIDPLSPDFARTPAALERTSFSYEPAQVDAVPAVTIVTPFFDTAPSVFADAVRSIERQSLQQWEWIIVDDGSTRDDARGALAPLEGADPRIRVIRHDSNRGVSAARNTAIREARAPFVLLFDSDDMMEPTTAEKWLWFLTSHAEYSFVDGFVVGFGEEHQLWDKGFRENKAFLRENFVGARALVRRDVALDVGGFDEAIRGGFEDWDFWLRCAASGYWGDTVTEYLAWYRTTGQTSTRERWPTWDLGDAQRTFRKTLRQRYPHLWRGGFPRIRSADAADTALELEAAPTENRLAKSKRRLLLVQPWTAMGGADKFNLDLVGQLDRHGWETTIVTTLHGDHTWMPQFARLTPDVFALSHFLEAQDYPRFLRYMIRSRQPDAILIAHSVFGYEALAYLRAVANGVPIVDYCHIVEERWLDGGYPRLSVEKRDLLDLQIASSAALKSWMVARGADPERVEICYTNIDPLEERRRSRTELDLPTDTPIIVYPVRMDDQKQPPVFARTMLELRERGHRFLALAVGSGPYLPWLRGFVKRKRLGEHVRCLGVQPNARVQDLMAVADCVFIPSTHEGISLAFYEAMAAGVPVVGADVGGQRELVTPDCGVLVERADQETEVQRYADVLGELLGDRERRRAMGMAGRERIRAHFALDQMGERMDALLRRASELAASDPRRVPTADEAREAAVAGVRFVRLTSPAPASRIEARSPQLRRALLRVLSAVGLPLYRVGMRMGMHWLEPLKDRVFQALYQRGK